MIWSTNIQNHRNMTFSEQYGHKGLSKIARPTCQEHSHGFLPDLLTWAFTGEWTDLSGHARRLWLGICEPLSRGARGRSHAERPAADDYFRLGEQAVALFAAARPVAPGGRS